MNEFFINPGKIQGHITIPPSKSHTLRALVFGMMAKGKSIVQNPLQSADTVSMIQACRSLGAKIEQFPDRIEIVGLNGQIHGADNVIDAGNSGLVFRFITALAGLSELPIVITGDHSIRNNRPIKPLLEGLSQLGAHAISTRNNGQAPVIVRGPINSGKTIISGEDSQPVSALLIASAFAKGEVEIEVKNPGEKPWMALTLAWLNRLGIRCENLNFEYYSIKGKNTYEGFEYYVPGDMSSAAFPIVAAIVTQSELTLHNVDMDDPQGDKEVIHVLRKMGAAIEIDRKEKKVHIRKNSSPLTGMKLDINDYIDAIAALAVIGCFAEGTTHITNAAIARTKECDRISCLTMELRKMGANVTELEDGMIIRNSALHGAALCAHKDHRLAMALTVAALAAKGGTRIEGVECVKKTFPDFKEQLCRLGAQIK